MNETIAPYAARRPRPSRRPALLAALLLLGLPVAAHAATLRSVTVLPSSSTLAVGSSRALAAIANFSDGSSRDVTALAEWTTSSSRVAVVRSEAPGRGTVTAVGPGSVRIGASVVDADGSRTKGSADVVVPTPPLQAIRTKPTTKRIEVGFDVRFQAIADRGNGITDDVTTKVRWTSTNPAVATVVATGPSAGLVRPVAPGTTQIVARDAATGIANTDGATEVRARVVSLSVEPRSIAIARRMRFPLRCYARRADGSRSNVTDDVEWSSSSTKITVGGSGPEAGVVRGSGDGFATIDCTDPVRGLGTAGTASATVAVTGRLVGLEVEPDPLVVAKGEARSAKAYGILHDGGKTGDVAEALEWSTSNPAVATTSNAAGDRGETTGVATGLATLAAVEPVTGIASTQQGNLRVLGDLVGLALDAGDGVVGREETIAIRARATYADGWVANVGEKCAWSSSQPGVATVSNATPRGVVTGLARGTTTVRADCPSGSASALVRVAGRALSLRLDPPAIEGEAVTTSRVEAIAVYEDGSERDASDVVAWSTAAPSIAVPDPESPGTLKLLRRGSTTVSALHPAGPAASGTVTVTPGIVAIEIVPGSLALRGSVPAKLRAQGRREDGTTKPLTKEVAWISGDPGIARVDDRPGEEGTVFGGSRKGTTSIRAVLGDGLLEASIPVRVSVLLESFDLVPAERTIPLLETRVVEARGRFDDGSARKINRSVVYRSSNPAVARVDDAPGRQGRVTAVSVGTALVTAVDVSSGKAASNPVVVTVVP